MSKEKTTLLLIGILIAFPSSLARLSIQGWLAFVGIYSFLFFWIIHLIYLFLIGNNFEKLSRNQKRIPWIAILSFPLIFLFQFDFGDNAGNMFVYEIITGDIFSTKYDNYIFSIAVIASIIYLISFIIFLFILKRLKRPKN